MAINHLSVHNDTAAHASSEGDHDEIFHSLCGSIGHLTDCCCVCIVSESDLQAVEGLGKHLGERNRALCRPNEVGCEGDLSGIVITVGSADSDSTDLAFFAGFLDKILDSCGQGIDKGLRVFVVICPDNSLFEDCTVDIDYADLGGLTSYIDTDYVILIHFA